MSTDTASGDDRERRESVDDAVSPGSVDVDPDERTEPDSPTDAAAPVAHPSQPSTASAADLDDGTPESDSDPESDASEADEDDAPGTTSPEPAPAGPVAPDGSRHRRRRSDAPPEPEAVPVRARGRAGWIALSIVLFLLLGGSVALNWYLWETTHEWQHRADDLTDVNYELGQELSDEQAHSMQLDSEIELLSQQLATSNQRVIELDAEKQGAIDSSEFASQQIDTLEQHLTSATAVASSMQRCIDGQRQLVTYLNEPENYDPEELAAYARSVDELCTSAQNSHERLRTELTQ